MAMVPSHHGTTPTWKRGGLHPLHVYGTTSPNSITTPLYVSDVNSSATVEDREHAQCLCHKMNTYTRFYLPHAGENDLTGDLDHPNTARVRESVPSPEVRAQEGSPTFMGNRPSQEIPVRLQTGTSNLRPGHCLSEPGVGRCMR